MTSFVKLMANDVWSEADILVRVRATIESVVPLARQDELRTIMLGHISQMRLATPEEFAEIMQVKALTEAAAEMAAAARADMALLLEAMALEQGRVLPGEASQAAQALAALRRPAAKAAQ